MSKLKVNYKLKKSKSDKSSVLLLLNFGYKEYDVLKDKNIYKPLEYYTGVTLANSEWNKVEKQPYSKQKALELAKIEEIAIYVYKHLTTENVSITPELLKSHIDRKLGKKEDAITTVNIVKFIREFPAKDQTTHKDTRGAYKNLADRLEKFEKSKNIIITTQSLNEKLFNSFIESVKGEVERANSVWKVYKNFSAVLNDISRKYKIKVFKPSEELAKSDKVKAVKENKVYMNFDQIQHLIEYEPKSEKLKNVKLILLTLLFTGCRYSDVFKIKPDQTYNKKGLNFRYAHFIADKSPNPEIICPILKPLEEAYEKNNGEPPYRISDVKFNLYVKDLIELAELKDEVKLAYTNSYGERKFETKPFYKFVTSHIGRRSFVSNLINYMPVTVLGRITGHQLTNKDVIFDYNKISLLDNAGIFVKELKRISETYTEEFPIQLV